MLRAAGVQEMENSETSEARIKRMRMRSWRRGTKEMDLILGPFADAELAAMPETELLTYDQLLDENDQDLLPWVLGQSDAPESLRPMIAQIGKAARARLTKG
jgi:antitoxin CptB